MNACLGLRESGNESASVGTQKGSDKVFRCLYKRFDRFFLTLFYDFSRQSRYADVKEPVYVKARRPQWVLYTIESG